MPVPACVAAAAAAAAAAALACAGTEGAKLPTHSPAQTSGIFGPNGRLAGDLKECWADGLCDYELPEFPRVDMS